MSLCCCKSLYAFVLLVFTCLSCLCVSVCKCLSVCLSCSCLSVSFQSALVTLQSLRSRFGSDSLFVFSKTNQKQQIMKSGHASVTLRSVTLRARPRFVFNGSWFCGSKLVSCSRPVTLRPVTLRVFRSRFGHASFASVLFLFKHVQLVSTDVVRTSFVVC